MAAEWQKVNSDYLAASLAWLHLRLQWLAGMGAGSSMVSDDQVESARQAMQAAESLDPSPALVMLSDQFGLSRFEQELLLLCAAMELDTRTPLLCAQAQGDLNKPYPTFGLALALFDDPLWSAVTPGGPLRYWQLVEVSSPTAQPLIARPLRADERIVSFLKGLNYLDDRLAPLLTLVEQVDEGDELPRSQQENLQQAVAHVQRASQNGRSPILQLLGIDKPSKEFIARHISYRLGFRLYRLSAEMLPTQLAELETFLRLWGRETLLLPVALYLDAQNIDGGPGGTIAPMIGHFLNRNQGITFMAVRDAWPDTPQASILLEIAKPSPAEQRDAWATQLAGQSGVNGRTPALLTGQFNLNFPVIQSITRDLLASTASQDGMPDRLWRECLLRTRPRLEALAQRIHTKATWEDIVLPENEERLLHQISAQVRQRSKVYDDWGFRQKMNRGLGITALFSGESGTGKTMAAEVLANDLHLDLYRIDLSSVVSKYIGETEKNLRQLFDAAEDGGAILFFDEADALFGKRSEVKDSHDRYANIEINYLLQRMEAYRGLAILATNMKSALDQAFLRRLRFVVSFPFPGAAERMRIWQRVFPAELPRDGLDFERLGRFNLTGGNIHNIALGAAFLAAQPDLPRQDTDQPPDCVTMPLVFEAIRTELRKLERPINEMDFR